MLLFIGLSKVPVQLAQFRGSPQLGGKNNLREYFDGKNTNDENASGIYPSVRK